MPIASRATTRAWHRFVCEPELPKNDVSLTLGGYSPVYETNEGITDMAHPDTARRKQLIARLKSAIATAAIVGTLGGWLAFGTHQTSTAVTSTTTAATVPAVAQSAANSNTAASSTTAATTSTTAAAATSNSTAAQTSAATQASTSSSSPTSRRGAVTSTRSSR